MKILSIIFLAGGMLASTAGAVEYCKVFVATYELPSQSDAEQAAWKQGRDRCWMYEREIGRTTTYDPGSIECVSRPVGPNTWWRCTYKAAECCYTN